MGLLFSMFAIYLLFIYLLKILIYRIYVLNKTPQLNVLLE